MAYLGDIQIRGDMTDIKQLVNYMYQLEEQVRYALNNLDGENIQAGAINAEQLSGTLNARLRSVEKTAEKFDQHGAEQLANEAIAVNAQGVRQTKGLFQSKAGVDSYLHWGGEEDTPALSLDGQGRIRAQALTLPGGAAVEKTAASLPFRIYVGIDRPNLDGVLWVKPGELQNGEQACQVIYLPEQEEEEAEE